MDVHVTSPSFACMTLMKLHVYVGLSLKALSPDFIQSRSNKPSLSNTSLFFDSAGDAELKGVVCPLLKMSSVTDTSYISCRLCPCCTHFTHCVAST